jgi:hypothetical protein
MTEIVQTGGATKNSPLQIPDDALRALDGVKERLQLWYSKQNSQSDATLMLVIEQEFGDDLVNIVCIPCKVSYGACLIMALAVAKNQNPLQLNLTVAQDSKGR